MTIVCIVITFCLALFSCMVSNSRLLASQKRSVDSSEQPDNKSEKEGNSVPNDCEHKQDKISGAESVSKRQSFDLSSILRSLGVKMWLVIAVCTLITGFASFRTLSFDINTVGLVKAILCCELVMSAAIIDFFTKKIPNKLNIVFYIVGAIMLVMEFFFNKEEFTRQLVSSCIGLLVGFGFLFVVSLITKGGMGMGDVKLIGGLGFTLGIVALVYSFVYSMVFCLAAAIVMLISGKKKPKDKVPFAPFFYMGLIATVSLGTF